MIASLRLGLLALFLATHAAGEDRVAASLDAHLAAYPEGDAPFSYCRADYGGDLSRLPIGVFDSGIGGLTVLEAILALDVFHNDNLQPGPDGRPDFEGERFVYLGDQANMPYGNYPKVGRTDYLRELILKDAVFLLGNRYRDGNGGIRHDKPPVKAIVVACNTATAYGIGDIQAAVARWNLPVIVVGVVEAGARGLLSHDETGAIAVMATVGTCDSGVYPRTIQSTLGRAGRGIATITQHGSADLAAVIEGDPSRRASLDEQVAHDVRRLVETHRESQAGREPKPLARIMLGCTHFPLVAAEIEATFAALREEEALAPFIAERRDYIDPAEWTARELFRELALARLRYPRDATPAAERDRFFLSIANPDRSDVGLNSDGSLDDAYKYGRDPGHFLEDTIVVPMTKESLPESGRRLVSVKLPRVWRSMNGETSGERDR